MTPVARADRAVLYIDTSALLRRYVQDPGSMLVEETLDAEQVWCASALARSETQLALRRLAGSPGQLDELWAAFRADWDAMTVIPVDDRCLARAVELGATYGLRTVDAIHVAAAARLPRPVRFLTFSHSQLPAASMLGFDVITPLAE
ncbi:MAG: type II toxin-antitoxin system VapC family toxin [Acidimicrobiia bacterium]|nr:type II toxin-antitoxin system VapC family toxin [Acidimicrobiia bacterium]